MAPEYHLHGSAPDDFSAGRGGAPADGATLAWHAVGQEPPPGHTASVRRCAIYASCQETSSCWYWAQRGVAGWHLMHRSKHAPTVRVPLPSTPGSAHVSFGIVHGVEQGALARWGREGGWVVVHPILQGEEEPGVLMLGMWHQLWESWAGGGSSCVLPPLLRTNRLPSAGRVSGAGRHGAWHALAAQLLLTVVPG